MFSCLILSSLQTEAQHFNLVFASMLLSLKRLLRMSFILAGDHTLYLTLF